MRSLALNCHDESVQATGALRHDTRQFAESTTYDGIYYIPLAVSNLLMSSVRAVRLSVDHTTPREPHSCFTGV